MEIFIEKQLITFLNSLILGLIFGAIYDIIRIQHIICGIASYFGARKNKDGLISWGIFALFDAVFVSCVTVVLSVFVYWQNNGVVRAYILVPCALGFALYYFTVGKLVMAFSETIVRLIRLVVYVLAVRPIRFAYRVICKVAVFVWKHTGGRVILALCTAHDRKRCDRIMRKNVDDVLNALDECVQADAALDYRVRSLK